MPTARTSQGRTPSRAYLGGSAVSPASAVLVSTVLVSTVLVSTVLVSTVLVSTVLVSTVLVSAGPVTRSADHNLARGGCSTVFHD